MSSIPNTKRKRKTLIVITVLTQYINYTGCLAFFIHLFIVESGSLVAQDSLKFSIKPRMPCLFS